MQAPAEYDKRQAFLLDTQPQAKPAELVHARLRTGEQAGQHNEERNRRD